MTDAGLVEVQLLKMPLALRERAEEHSDELLREMTLIALQIEEGEGVTLPRRLTELVAETRQTYGAFAVAPAAEIDAALAAGARVVERVVYRVPASTGAFCRHLIDVLNETEEFCRAGTYLLALGSPPDIHGYRIWALEEFVRQLDGLPPRSWPEYAAEHGLSG